MDALIIFSSVSLVGFMVYSIRQNIEHNKNTELLNDEIKTLRKDIAQLYEKNISSENNLKALGNNLVIIKKAQNEFDETVKNINVQTEDINKRIDNLSNYFSIGKSLDNKENKKYGSINSHIIDDYKNMNYRDFLDKYHDYKTIGLLNYEDIRNNRAVPPNFSEIATGNCTAVLIENALYSIVVKKGLELRSETIESIGISYIFDISEEPLKGFFYGNWELTKLPIFQKLSNDKWICLSKGFLQLRPEIGNVNSESLKEEQIEETYTESDILANLKVLSTIAIDEVTNFSQRIFLSRNPDAISVKMRKYKEKVFFNMADEGNFYSFYPHDYDQPLFADYYFLFPKADHLKQIFSTNQANNKKENSLLNKIFRVKDKVMKDKFLEQDNSEEIVQEDNNLSQVFDIFHDKNISSARIKKLAIIKLKKINKEQKPSYELIEKGELILN